MEDLELQPQLTGSKISLRPLRNADFESLYKAASDPKVWETHPDSERHKRDDFRERFFDGAISSKGALAIEELETGKIIGSSRYYKWRPETKEISIGYTFLERKHWGIGTNQELKDLMLTHIYQWADVVWFHVSKDNMRSRRAVENGSGQALNGSIRTGTWERHLRKNQSILFVFKLGFW